MVAMMQTYLYLRLEHGIGADELDSLVPYQYDVWIAMYKKHMAEKAKEHA